MLNEPRSQRSSRAFKTAWFARRADKARITDSMLCTAWREIQSGQCDDLGGGVFKKRLARIDYRSIVLAKSGMRWIYEYLFSKQDRDNIDAQELAEFRKLASLYGALTPDQLARLCHNGDLQQICNDHKTQLQE